MATTKSTPKTRSAAPKAPKSEVKAADEVKAELVQEASPAETKQEGHSYVPKAMDPNQIVTVRNGFHGRLIYQSRKTGEVFDWDEFGAEQDMELAELRNARSSAKAFFINNWFMFDDPEVIDYLGVRQYYQYALNLEDFDLLFQKTPAEIESTMAKLSDGQKRSVAYRAKQLISDGVIDSIKVITTLERCLGVELIER